MGRPASLAEGRHRHSGLTSVVEDSPALSRIDAIAAALVERARPVAFRLAKTQAEVAIAQRLRGRAMVEQGWIDPDSLTDGRDEDADDGRATHILAFLGDEPVGTCRLVYPERGHRLPMEKAAGARLPVAAVEVGRIVVTHGRSHGSVVAGLIASAWLELRAHGHRRICGSVSAGILRLYRRLGFLVQVVGPPVRTFGEDRHPILFEPSHEAAAVAADRYRA